MPVESIITIVIAIISTLSSIATFTYMKFHKSFGDQQDTVIEITNTFSQNYDERGNKVGDNNNSKIIINMKNFEQYFTEASKLEKSNQQKVVTTSTSKEVIDNSAITAKTATTSPKVAISENTPLVAVNTKNNSASSKVTNYANNSNYTSLDEIVVTKDEELTSVLNNNAHGDQIISETRIAVISEALKTFKEMVQAHYHNTESPSHRTQNDVEFTSNVTGDQTEFPLNRA